MARIAIVFGLLLCAMTVSGLVVSTSKSPYQFVPMIQGIPILFCGVVALNPHRRRHAMHASAMIAALGCFVGGMRSLSIAIRWFRGNDINGFAFQLVTLMTSVCLIFLILCVISFINARRRGETGQGNIGAAKSGFAKPEKPKLKT